ncbi:hypothetical protein J4459_02625 [Candidatus Woesearchaeota archaeon]|nr:hypothetical protein [Candidatus Woesearchaeota archaeon]
MLDDLSIRLEGFPKEFRDFIIEASSNYSGFDDPNKLDSLADVMARGEDGDFSYLNDPSERKNAYLLLDDFLTKNSSDLKNTTPYPHAQAHLAAAGAPSDLSFATKSVEDSGNREEELDINEFSGDEEVTDEYDVNLLEPSDGGDLPDSQGLDVVLNKIEGLSTQAFNLRATTGEIITRNLNSGLWQTRGIKSALTGVTKGASMGVVGSSSVELENLVTLGISGENFDLSGTDNTIVSEVSKPKLSVGTSESDTEGDVNVAAPIFRNERDYEDDSDYDPNDDTFVSRSRRDYEDDVNDDAPIFRNEGDSDNFVVPSSTVVPRFPSGNRKERRTLRSLIYKNLLPLSLLALFGDLSYIIYKAYTKHDPSHDTKQTQVVDSVKENRDYEIQFLVDGQELVPNESGDYIVNKNESLIINSLDDDVKLFYRMVPLDSQKSRSDDGDEFSDFSDLIDVSLDPLSKGRYKLELKDETNKIKSFTFYLINPLVADSRSEGEGEGEGEDRIKPKQVKIQLKPSNPKRTVPPKKQIVTPKKYTLTSDQKSKITSLYNSYNKSPRCEGKEIIKSYKIGFNVNDRRIDDLTVESNEINSHRKNCSFYTKKLETLVRSWDLGADGRKFILLEK